jgi:hypothetical protein
MSIASNRPRLLRLATGAALIGALALGACGKEGSLERPAPLFGAKAKNDFAAEKKREQRQALANRQGATSGDPAPPAPDYGQGDPALDPLRASPTPGAAPNPFSDPNAGGLFQDPAANPNALPR